MDRPTGSTPMTPQGRAVIFHGYHATPADHWFGWLAAQLAAHGIPATVPALPDPLQPDAARWEATVGTALGIPDKNSVVVAHSLGCLAVLRYLRSLADPWRLSTLVLVSGFLDPLPALPELDAFIGDGCDVTGIPEHIDQITIIRSDDDPLVPPPLTDRLAENFGVKVNVVPGAGHFLTADGVFELLPALDAVVSPPRASRFLG